MADSYIANKGWDRPMPPQDEECGMAEAPPLENESVEHLLKMLEHSTEDVKRAIVNRNAIVKAINVKMDAVGTSFSNSNGHYSEFMDRNAKEYYHG